MQPHDVPESPRVVPPLRGRALGVGLAGWMLAAYVALLPVQFGVSAERRFAPSDLFLLGYMLARGSRIRWRRSDWTGWHALVIFVLATGALVAQLHGQFDSSAVSQKIFGMVFLYLSLFALLDFMESLDRVRWLLRVLCQSVALNAAVFLFVMLLQNLHVIGWPSMNLGGARLSGLLIDPNALGGIMVVSLILLLALSDRTTRGARRSKLRIEVVLVVAILFTFSRSAWIGLGVALITGFLLQPRRFTGIVRRAIPYLVVGGALVAVTVLPSVERLSSRTDQVAGRVDILQESYSDLLSAPVTGIGLGAAYVRHGRIIHNTAMFFLTELGPLGLVALLGLLGHYATRAYKASQHLTGRDRDLARVLLMSHAAMFGVSLGIEATYQRHWWLLFAAITATYRFTRVPEREPNVARVPRAEPLNPLLLSGRLALVAPPWPSNGRSILANSRQVLRTGARLPDRRVLDSDLSRPTLRAAASPELMVKATVNATESVPERSTALGGAAARVPRPSPSPVRWPDSRWTEKQVADGASPVEVRSTLIGQASLGVLMWVAAVLAARSVTAHGLGSLAFVLALSALAVGAWRSMHTDRARVANPWDRTEVARSTAGALGATWLVGLALGTIWVIVGGLAPDPLGSALQVLGLALPFLLVREVGRSYGRLLSRPRVPSTNNIAWAVALAAALAIAPVAAGDKGSTYLAAWSATGALAGVLVLLQLRLVPDVGGGVRWLRETLPARVPALLRFAVSVAPIFLILVLMPLVSSLSELGVVSAACVVYAPLFIVMQLVPLLLHDRMSSMSFSSVRKLASQLAVVLGILAALWCAVVTAMPGGVGHWLVGDVWGSTRSSRIFIGLAVVAFASGRGVAVALRLWGSVPRPPVTSVLRATAALAVALVLVGFVGATGAAMAIFAGQILALAADLYQLRRISIPFSEGHIAESLRAGTSS